jgi:hypothetical protein
MSRHSEFCKHYRAMSEHATCEKGVAYDDFKGLGFDQRPCFERNGVAPPGCPLAEFQTAEERAERDREMEKRFERIGKARRAIVEHLGGPWKEGDGGKNGRIDCPSCGVAGALGFSRSGYNGHIHARCDTEDCASWME